MLPEDLQYRNGFNHHRLYCLESLGNDQNQSESILRFSEEDNDQVSSPSSPSHQTDEAGNIQDHLYDILSEGPEVVPELDISASGFLQQELAPENDDLPDGSFLQGLFQDTQEEIPSLDTIPNESVQEIVPSLTGNGQGPNTNQMNPEVPIQPGHLVEGQQPEQGSQIPATANPTPAGGVFYSEHDIQRVADVLVHNEIHFVVLANDLTTRGRLLGNLILIGTELLLNNQARHVVPWVMLLVHETLQLCNRPNAEFVEQAHATYKIFSIIYRIILGLRESEGGSSQNVPSPFMIDYMQLNSSNVQNAAQGPSNQVFESVPVLQSPLYVAAQAFQQSMAGFIEGESASYQETNVSDFIFPLEGERSQTASSEDEIEEDMEMVESPLLPNNQDANMEEMPLNNGSGSILDENPIEGQNSIALLQSRLGNSLQLITQVINEFFLISGSS